MTPAELGHTLGALIDGAVRLSVMIWGAPGVGKSSVVARVARERDMGLVDLRLSQLAPTDLRGLPVPRDGLAYWYPPEFLPREGRGVLFLDELNLCPPAIQGIAQQLILDRRVGSYRVPEGWFIWAAGNRAEDRAAVFEMPAPLGNRFLHLQVQPDQESFRDYAIAAGLHERIVAFLAFRPDLLHRLDPGHPAWPSPRTWEMASRLHALDLDVAPAVGEAAAAELDAFVRLYQDLVRLEPILAGEGRGVRFPKEPSRRYALTVGLAARAKTTDQALAAFRWLVGRAGEEWVQLMVSHLAQHWRARAHMDRLVACLRAEPDIRRFLRDYNRMLSGD